MIPAYILTEFPIVIDPANRNILMKLHTRVWGVSFRIQGHRSHEQEQPVGI